MNELEIKIGTGKVIWSYVPSEVNPADDISHGLSPSQLVRGHRYLSGPDFLKSEKGNWPRNKLNPPENDAEQ